MRKLLWVTALILAPALSHSADLTAADAATDALLGQGGRPTGMQIRVTRNQGAWAMDGKTPEGSWKSLACDQGCELRPSTPQEAQTYLAALPPTLQQEAHIACIQNMAGAFCRLMKHSDRTKAAYVYVALVTGRPTPMPMKRLTP
jgi:hypothetical protein